VLAETVWTLAGREYRLTGKELVTVIEGPFNDSNIHFEDGQVAWRALQAYRDVAPADDARSARGASFADASIVFKALCALSDSGAPLDGVYTFDTAMRRLPYTASL